MKRQIAMVAVALVLFAGSSAWGQVQYTVTDLGTLGGSSSAAYGINASGQVVGEAQTSSGNNDAFLYSNGTMVDLGTLGGTGSVAYGINASGQVVGYAYTSSGNNDAFLYSNGTMTDLGTLPGFQSSLATGINANGQVVGASPAPLGATKGSPPVHAFLYSSGTMVDLGTLGGRTSAANSINASGQAVGEAQTSSGNNDAFLYSNGTMVDLGTLGGRTSAASGINASGQVVGYAETSSGTYDAFLYSNGTMTDLGTLSGNSSSLAYGINASGQVVGDSFTGTDPLKSKDAGNAFPFLSSNGTMTDLNSLIDSASGWTLEDATAINDNGQIVGDGINPQGQDDAFLLTPVPEPSTLVLLGIGAVSLIAYAWGQRRWTA